MPTLTTPNDKFQLVTANAVSTDYTVVYQDTPAPSNNYYDATGTVDGSVTTATTTDIVPAPQPRTIRRILEITIRNTHASSSQTVKLQKSVNGTGVVITPAITLSSGESMTFTPSAGYEVFDSTGRKKTSSSSTFRSPQLMSNPSFQANDITSTTLIGPGWCIASYMGKAPRAFDWATVRTRVATACSVGAGEWAQVAIATGDISPGAAPTLTVRGFTSVEGTYNSTGLKSTVVSVAGINEGDNIWVLAGCSLGTGGITAKLRAGLADDLQGGGFALVSSEPSAILNTATAFTILGATVSTPWFELIT